MCLLNKAQFLVHSKDSVNILWINAWFLIHRRWCIWLRLWKWGRALVDKYVCQKHVCYVDPMTDWIVNQQINGKFMNGLVLAIWQTKDGWNWTYKQLRKSQFIQRVFTEFLLGWYELSIGRSPSFSLSTHAKLYLVGLWDLENLELKQASWNFRKDLMSG